MDYITLSSLWPVLEPEPLDHHIRLIFAVTHGPHAAGDFVLAHIGRDSEQFVELFALIN